MLDGLKAGDEVITARSTRCAELSDGGDVKVQQNNRNRNRPMTSK